MYLPCCLTKVLKRIDSNKVKCFNGHFQQLEYISNWYIQTTANYVYLLWRNRDIYYDNTPAGPHILLYTESSKNNQIKYWANIDADNLIV